MGLFVLLRPANELSIKGCDPSIDLRQLRAGVLTSRTMRGLNPAPRRSSINTARNRSSFRLPRRDHS
jgi:hypothetical protein